MKLRMAPQKIFTHSRRDPEKKEFHHGDTEIAEALRQAQGEEEIITLMLSLSEHPPRRRGALFPDFSLCGSA
jgi:hypothetical protein